MTYYIRNDDGQFVPVAYNPVYEVNVTAKDIAGINTAIVGINYAVENNDRPAFDREIGRIAVIGLRINTQPRPQDDAFEQLRESLQTRRDQEG